MKQFRTHIAIVEDADERAIGIVTMTDVLDAIFEDIFVEPDELANK
jgi:CBS domain containing-hemolysin-like protein